MPRVLLGSSDGFSLVEVLVAVGLMATALTTLASLFALSIESNLASRHRTYAAVLAQQKLEELRADAWESYSGQPSTGLDYVDLEGKVVGVGADPSGRGVYARRWSIEPLPADPGNAVIIQVEAARKSSGLSPLDRSRVVTVKTKKP